MTIADALLRRGFGLPEGLLGRIGGVIMAHTNRRYAEWAVDLLRVRPGEHVLEIGFGPGVAVQVLAERTGAGRIAGVDPSPVMLRQAERRNARFIGRGRVELHLGSVERLPFADRRFDKALAINSMQMWPDAAAGLREVVRVLKNKATLALCFTVHSGRLCEGLPELLTASGFHQSQVVDGHKAFCVLAVRPPCG